MQAINGQVHIPLHFAVTFIIVRAHKYRQLLLRLFVLFALERKNEYYVYAFK